MSEADDEEVSRIIRDLVDVCTFKELNTQNLPHFDIEYIFMNLRAKSIGETVEVIVTCECEEKINTSFNIDNIVVEKKEGHTNKIMINDDVGIEMKYPSIRDVILLSSSDKSDDIVDMVVDCVKGIFDNENYWEAADQTKEEINEFIQSLTKEQFDKIEEFFVTAPKVVQTVECDCPKCGKHNISRIEGLHNFFV
jgi:hypothetical protein